MDRRRVDDAVRAGDVDELLRIVDGASSAREWDELEMLRARCAAATETGHQLWPVASRAAYLLALDAPGRLAGAVLVEGAGRFAPGPLPEVAAQRHPWADLAPSIPSGPHAVVTAHERVLRGEDLTDAVIDGPAVLELPLRLAAWEPSYALAEYGPDTADFPAPAPPPARVVDEVLLPARPDDDSRAAEPSDEVAEALRDAVRHWSDESNGTVAAVGVSGDTTHAIAAIETGSVRVVGLEPADALARLAWAAASGGAHAPRPGAAAGRFSAWWVAGATTDLLDDWPPDPEELGSRVAALEWATWERADASPSGWQLHLAIADPARGRAWAVRARDSI
ncbi:MAG: DUF6183 family protein [Acidimicrobiia bacterium]